MNRNPNHSIARALVAIAGASALVVSAAPAALAVRPVTRAAPAPSPAVVTPAVVTPGTQLWLSRYDGPSTTDSDSSGAVAMAMSPDGTKVFVTGASEGSTSRSDYATVAYNASTGAQLWVKRYNGSANKADTARDVAVSPDGTKVFVTGEGRQTTGGYDYVTIAYNAGSGALLWKKSYNGPANSSDAAYAIGVSPSGDRVFVTGFSTGAENFDYATVAYAADTGSLAWVSRFNNPDNLYSQDMAAALAVSPDGSQVIVTGSSQDVDGVYGYATVAYAASDGEGAWARRYAAAGALSDFNIGAVALAISPDSLRVFVTGSSQDSTGDLDYATLAYETVDGADGWLMRYDGPADDFDSANALALSADGSSVFVTGGSYGVNSSDYATVGYSAASGSPLWTRRYGYVAFGLDIAKALTVSPDGATVFVTGESWRSADTTNSDYATLAYSTTDGATSWTKRYNGSVQDVGRALVVSPNGARLFVSGRSVGSGGTGGVTPDFDYTTIAYKAN